MDEIHHLSCMLVVLLRDQQQQFILEHTGESKDRIPIAAVWECLLGAFPAFRARHQAEVHVKNGYKVGPASIKVPPKVGVMLHECLGLDAWRSWSNMHIDGRSGDRFLRGVKLGSLSDGVRKRAHDAVHAQIKTRLKDCREWCFLRQLNSIISAAYESSVGAVSLESELVAYVLEQDPGLYWALDVGQTFTNLDVYLEKLKLEVQREGGTHGTSIVIGIKPRIGKDANLGRKATVPLVGNLPCEPSARCPVDVSLLELGTSAGTETAVRNRKWLDLLRQGADASLQQMSLAHRAARRLALQRELEKFEELKLLPKEVKKTGLYSLPKEVKFSLKAAASQNAASAKVAASARKQQRNDASESDYNSVLDEHFDPDLIKTEFDELGELQKNYSLSSTVDDTMVVNSDGTKIEDAKLRKRVNDAAQQGYFGCRQYIKPSGSNKRYGYKQIRSISVANYQFAHGVEQPSVESSKPKASSWLKYSEDGSYNFMASKLSVYDVKDTMGDCKVEERRFHVDGELLYDSEEQREQTFAVCKEVTAKVQPLKGQRHTSSTTRAFPTRFQPAPLALMKGLIRSFESRSCSRQASQRGAR